MTIRQHLQLNRLADEPYVVCEYDPLLGLPATLDSEFHGLAEVTLGKVSKLEAGKDRQLRVCRACALEQGALAFALPFGGKRQPELGGKEADREQ